MKFIADVHLGKLARLLRMLGFDTIYRNDFTTTELTKISKEQGRMLLSRNASLSKNKLINCLVVTNEDAFIQLQQVILHFDLKDQVRPFSRCIVCNGTLEPVSKERIVHLLKRNTAEYFNEFWQCTDCRRIYWKGSHFERMLKTIQTIRS